MHDGVRRNRFRAPDQSQAIPLNRTLLVVCPLIASSLAFAAPPPAIEHGQLDADPALFTVLAAINAAGYDADLNSTLNNPLRAKVREYIEQRKPECLDDLKKFFAVRKKPDWGSELSQYVSFALSVTGPPDFKFRFQGNDLPPDVLPLQGLNDLIARFYKEADIETVWEKSQPFFDRAIATYQPGVVRAVTQVNAYARNTNSGFLGRRFQVYIDLLGAPNQVHTRSYADDYLVVVTPSAEPQIDEIRHAYLHYMLDPLTLKFAEPLSQYRRLADYADTAPALEQFYKDDFSLLATESLIKAVESRLARSDERPAMIDQAMREGFVMTAAFADALLVYEKQQQSLRLFFPDMVATIDLRREDKRLANIQFAARRASRVLQEAPAAPQPELAPSEKTLAKAESEYADRKLDIAKQSYLRVLEMNDVKSVHARAYYGLARIAALERDPELSEKFFRKTLESGPDAATRCWTFVYLGRLADAQGDREHAAENYKAALAIAGGPAAARKAAEKGLQESFKKPE